jgi:hypothetical protein
MQFSSEPEQLVRGLGTCSLYILCSMRLGDPLVWMDLGRPN